jgi:hypothetical protein
LSAETRKTDVGQWRNKAIAPYALSAPGPSRHPTVTMTHVLAQLMAQETTPPISELCSLDKRTKQEQY